MENKITLAYSFRLRNRIKTKISGLTALIYNCQFSVESDLSDAYNKLDNLSLDENIKQAETLMSLLQELNRSIEAVNRENRESLIKLETLKSKLFFYGKLIEKIRRHKPIIKQWNEDRDNVTDIKYSLIVDSDSIFEKFKKTQKEIAVIEQSLIKANNSLMIEFKFLQEAEALL
jgi:hypothetical protein